MSKAEAVWQCYQIMRRLVIKGNTEFHRTISDVNKDLAGHLMWLGSLGTRVYIHNYLELVCCGLSLVNLCNLLQSIYPSDFQFVHSFFFQEPSLQLGVMDPSACLGEDEGVGRELLFSSSLARAGLVDGQPRCSALGETAETDRGAFRSRRTVWRENEHTNGLQYQAGLIQCHTERGARRKEEISMWNQGWPQQRSGTQGALEEE